jgi:hypothetical protein
MLLHRFRQVLLVTAIAVTAGARVEAQSTIGEDFVDRFNAFFSVDHSRPMTVPELCCRLDCIAEELRDKGLVLVKQPDVFSQARMTRFRNDFENQLSSDLANFHLVLAARINRLDSATTTSATALGAALSAPGTTNVAVPPAGNTSAAASLLNPSSGLFPSTTQPSLFGSSAPGLFNSLGVGPNALTPPSAANAAALTLGVEPTVYLEEKQRFLNYLNHLRRLNLGPDQNDSSGYGLYLVRLPVSITPGECTYQGHGADLSVQVEHEFTRDFLPSAFRRMVINDVIDQLGPFLYEVIRTGYYEKILDRRYQAAKTRLALSLTLAELIAKQTAHLKTNPPREIAEKLRDYILRTNLQWSNDPSVNLRGEVSIQYRRDVLARYACGVPKLEHAKAFTPFTADSEALTYGPASEFLLRSDRELRQDILMQLEKLIPDHSHLDDSSANRQFREFLQGLYHWALPDDVQRLDDLLGVDPQQRAQITGAVTAARSPRIETAAVGFMNVSLPSSRSAKQAYPIKPREIPSFFLEDNLAILAKDIVEASRTPKEIRSNEIRDYLRHLLDGAYNAMTRVPDEAMASAPPLADDNFMTVLLQALQERDFEGQAETLAGTPNAGAPSRLEALNEYLVYRLKESRRNIKGYPIGALCWALAIDAALLDAAMKRDARKVFVDNGVAVEPIDSVHFYHPNEYCDDVSRDVFCQYIRHRWPIITFSLDPVTDQQNIADSFSLNRDLQLALSFAFATGQINFSQLNTFRRQIQQSADTIALNRTITGFMQGNDIFGFRFTPRFQNPPNQRTNLGVIASQLISGGPGPNYQIRKSKLEPGVRELNAVLLIPTFLPVMRMNVSSNWFKLTDPEHLVHPTGKMMERGRRVQELRDAVQVLCNAHDYRAADLRVLQSKMAQLDTMLPMQSLVVQLPFENSAAGFDLFLQGSAALVPVLTGFSGVDVITLPAAPAAGATGGAGATTGMSATGGNTATTTSTTSPATFSIQTLATPGAPSATTTYTITGGSTAIADVFVFGKYISLLDTRVIAGGRVASFEILSREVIHVQIPPNVIPTTTEDNQTYIEVYLATPNGMSNSLLIPCKPAATPTPTKVAYDVGGTTPSLDVYYQWLPGHDGKATLAPSSDPSKNAVTITWDSDTGLAPRQIQTQFAGTVNNQNVVIELAATASTSGDYTIDGTSFTSKLLERLQSIAQYPAIPPTPITFTVTVLPWTPADPQGLRAIKKAKTLPTKLTVNLQYNAVGPLPPPTAKPAADGGAKGTSGLMTPGGEGGVRIASGRTTDDPAVVRTAQANPLPNLSNLPSFPSQSVPSFLNVPQPSQALAAPALLGPNVESEAEQISKVMTGQPIATMVSGLGQQGLAALPPTVTSQLPQIIVNPAPVTVIAPPSTNAKKKHTSAVHRMLNRFGNRASSAGPSQ